MIRTLLFWGLLGLLLFGCARHPAPALAGVSMDSAPPPDSLRVKLLIELPMPDSTTEEVDGVLWAKPGERYRLELTGPLGMQMASLLWTREGWTGLVPPQERFVQGNGEVVSIPGVLLPPISVHRLLAFAWGEMVPADSSQPYRLERDPQSGRLLALVFPAMFPGAELRFEYSEAQVRILRGHHWLMTLQIRERKSDLKWGAGVWRLVVPPGWKAL